MKVRNVKEQEKGWNCVRLPPTKKTQQNQKATKLILSKGYGLTWQKCVLSTTHIPVWTRNRGFASDSHRKRILTTGFIFCVPLIISGPSVFFLSSVQSRDFAMDSNFFRIHLQRNEGLPYCLPLHIHTFLSHISYYHLCHLFFIELSLLCSSIQSIQSIQSKYLVVYHLLQNFQIWFLGQHQAIQVLLHITFSPQNRWASDYKLHFTYSGAWEDCLPWEGPKLGQ